MAGKNTAVFGIYMHMANLESALNELRIAGLGMSTSLCFSLRTWARRSWQR